MEVSNENLACGDTRERYLVGGGACGIVDIVEEDEPGGGVILEDAVDGVIDVGVIGKVGDAGLIGFAEGLGEHEGRIVNGAGRPLVRVGEVGGGWGEGLRSANA